jgi:hypothetical protein
VTAPIPEDLEPLAVWDAAKGYCDHYVERSEWAKRHLGDPRYIYHVEFYLLDTAFAVAGRFVPNVAGLKWQKDGEPVTETVIVPLAELPPAHLLRG